MSLKSCIIVFFLNFANEDSDECIADSDDPSDYRYYDKFFRVITYDL